SARLPRRERVHHSGHNGVTTDTTGSGRMTEPGLAIDSEKGLDRCGGLDQSRRRTPRSHDERKKPPAWTRPRSRRVRCGPVVAVVMTRPATAPRRPDSTQRTKG